MNTYKKLQTLGLASLSLFLLASPAFAAAPDGLGPWADTVVSFNQGLMKNGLAVPAIRSDPTAALGVAENDTVAGHFVSLGFGGNIVLGFDNGISGGTLIVEATNPGYPLETAKVEVSPNGTNWTVAGHVTQGGTVSLPRAVKCAKFVRITDTSNKAIFPDAIADGYDVDGVKSTGDNCTIPTPTPTPTPHCKKGCCGGNTTITQTNNTSVVTGINASSNTGGNKIKDNSGGKSSITTGDASTTTSVMVTGSSNTVITH